jgi:hypothetical protein
MKPNIFQCVCISAALCLFAAVPAWCQTGGKYELSWSTIDGGGGTSAGGQYRVTGTIGQPDAGTMSGGGYILNGGFLAGSFILPDAHWWKFNECSGITAYDSIGDAYGVFNGGNPRWLEDFIGCVIDLNGISDYFSVTDLNNVYIATQSFTVTGWFNTSQSTGIQTIVGNWAQWYYSPAPWVNLNFYSGWQALVEDNKVKAMFATNCPAIGLSNITGTKNVNDGRWHHFAFVHPNYHGQGTSNTILYVDGNPEGTPAVLYYCNANTEFRIGDGSYIVSGGPATLKGGPFCGMIDDVMIFNRALTADEVYQLYATGP